MNFEFLHPAAREFQEAFDWYEQRSARAAEGFREAVRDAIQRALKNPTRQDSLWASGRGRYYSIHIAMD
jgi:plasmid stabilization system protein ParE